jgi:hypothetical protein
VADASLPSMMFCFPERAAWIICSRAIEFGEEAVTEIKLSIIDDERFLVREKAFVTAVRRDEFVTVSF